MLTNSSDQAMQTLEITREIDIAAPIAIVFECILEQLGPRNEDPDRTPMPMRLEAWPGGRWFRDLGNNTGDFWGVVQCVRPSERLEIHGPMFMSSPAISHVSYALREEAGCTRIRFAHRAAGQLPPKYQDGGDINQGWTNYFERLGELVARATGESR
jgi:uncharacterized protein YndB with AHSA1/START domain